MQANDDKQEQIGPHPVLLDDHVKVRIKMQENIDEMRHPVPLTMQMIWHIDDYSRSPMMLLAKQ